MKAILMIYSDDDILEVSQVAAPRPADHVTEFVTTLAPFGRNVTTFTASQTKTKNKLPFIDFYSPNNNHFESF